MNIEHLKEDEISKICDWLKDKYPIHTISEGHPFYYVSRLQYANIIYDYNTANPLTPIDTDKMVECYKEMYDILKAVGHMLEGNPMYKNRVEVIKSVLEKSKLPE